MNNERFLALYDRVADAPNAISRLRRLIFDLAVRGKLVKQESGDEPASHLLKRIAKERSERISRGKIRRSKSLEPILSTPLSLPAGWEWVPLGETGNIFIGNSINSEMREVLEKTSNGIPYVATKDIGYGLDEINYENGLLVGSSEDQFKLVRASSVLLCAEGGSAGRKAALTNRTICIGNKLIANETWSVILPKFVLYVYLSGFFYTQFSRKMTGVIGGISIKNFLRLPFPLPPLDEQNRIVSKVDELMAVCNQLEAGHTIREKTRGRFSESCHARLRAIDLDTSSRHFNTRFFLNSLPHLTARAGQITNLRQTILDLAVRGKLVEQNKCDSEATNLIETIRIEREQKKRRVIGPEMMLVDFSIPAHWRWQSLDQIISKGPQNGLSPQRSNKVDARKAITLTATTSGKFDGRYFKNVEVRPEEATDYWLNPGDLLFQRGNAREYVGMAAVYDGPPNEFLFPDLIIRIRVSSLIDVRFVHLWCIAPFARRYLSLRAKGAQQSMPKINQRILKEIPVAIPPPDEQKRIVAKANRLMALCDSLEDKLNLSDNKRQHLLDSLIGECWRKR